LQHLKEARNKVAKLHKERALSRSKKLGIGHETRASVVQKKESAGQKRESVYQSKPFQSKNRQYTMRRGIGTRN